MMGFRALTKSFDSKVSWCGEPLVRQLGRYLHWPTVDPVAWRESSGRQGTAGQSTKRISFGAEQPSTIRLPWLRFSVIFLSCKANARVFYAKSGHGPHSSPPGAAASPKRLTNVALTPACDRASLSSEPRQPTSQSLSLPYLVQDNLGPSIWHNQSRPSACFKSLAQAYSPFRI